MDRIKASPQEVYELLEQQKRLQDMRSKLASILDKVNEAINSITVENLELRSAAIDNIAKKEEDDKPVIQFDPIQQDLRAEEINKMHIDLDLNYPEDEVETDEELDT